MLIYPNFLEKSTYTFYDGLMSNMPIVEADTSLLKKHLENISQPRDLFENPEGLAAIETYIREELISCGYDTRPIPFEFQGRTFHNLLARTRTADPKSARFIIGAHFDAVPSTPGADDNASGVAGLLEAARLLATFDEVAGIDFIAFNAEEYGMVGSSHYVRQLQENKTSLRGMLSLEMIGYTSREPNSQKLPIFLKPFYPSTGTFIALVGDNRASALLKQTKAAFKTVEGLHVEALKVPAKGRLIPECRLSDHSPFWDAGYPALLVTDTSFFRNPHYHGPGDRIDTLDLDFLTRVTEGVVRTVLSLSA
ncbi:MAG: M28 family peptidase [Candidatus Omnitrophota bacterium]|nr:M28 family peptidase [Candidatus Omnitrophota bacterium]